jgi:hypothetical protein
VHARLLAGFRHRLRALLAALPAEERHAEVERLIAEAQERSRRDGLSLADALFLVHEEVRVRRGRPALPAAPPADGAAPAFLCDPSLGGLARWLRAAGYDARLAPELPVHRLPDEARARGLVLLTSDAETLERRIAVDGSLRLVWLPSALHTAEKLALVLRDLGLPLREPRCMACGGELLARPKDAVRPRIPPRTALWKDEYFVCVSCERLFWQGTHWQRIVPALREAAAA